MYGAMSPLRMGPGLATGLALLFTIEYNNIVLIEINVVDGSARQ